MTEQSPAEVIFFTALEKPTPDERAAYLNAACQDDPDLRRRVERLLNAHPQVGSFLEPAAAHAGTETTTYKASAEKAGCVIAGKYKLVEPVGEGGMGTVWVAQQTEPVKRLVAVKLIKLGMDSSAVLARFEAERQALALMEHPNIARVLDGGATPDGRPFFVMELVKGVPITRFCDARKLTPRQRLELFVPVCQAIQHAHQKGIIHRDIKPSNVLVALYDDRPVPKVIDFGVAKATGQTLTDKSLMTGFGTVVGTPEYMSPEQASLNNLDIDTRSDVYSLGVLLYELLAGSPPFRSDELRKAGLMEILRVVCEVEPPRPSVKLSTADRRASISADRGTEPRNLTGLLRNELDWIVMKALEKDRARRYETVSGFAADVQRYLAGEAVQAHPPSAAYRLRKFARKHRAALTTAAAFAVLLIAAAAVSSWLAVKANLAEAEAREKRKEAEDNAAEAEKNLNLYADSAKNQIKALADLATKAKSLQIDIDLGTAAQDARSGILHLARTIIEAPENPIFPDMPGMMLDDGQATVMVDISGGPEIVALREFATVAILATGQNYAPLLPPITHDGQEVVRFELSPDKQTLLTLGKDFTARMWETRTAKQIAVLRQGNERVVNCGFSPDGRTVFTDDQTSIARFWDVPSGRFRAATEARPNRYDIPQEWLVKLNSSDPLIAGKGRALTQRYVVTNVTDRGPGFGGGISHDSHWEGPIELWDTATGRLVAQLDVPSRIVDQDRLDVPGRTIDDLHFLGDRWITAQQDNALLVFSADDGRRLARLEPPNSEGLQYGVYASPNGHRIATISSGDHPTVRLWDTASWKLEASLKPTNISNGCEASFVTDELFEVAEGWESQVFRFGQAEPVARFRSAAPIGTSPCLTVGHLLHLGDGRIMDMQNWQVLVPPAGRKYHPDLARFAPDGRFVLALDAGGGSDHYLGVASDHYLIDTRTEKSISHPWYLGDLPVGSHLPETGWVSGETEYAALLRLLPTNKLSFPPELLELWAQVAVRGELDAEGRFSQWDQDTWEQKRQELAAQPAPFSDFPFPGYVATDKLHWLRAEFGEAETDADKLRLAQELLRQCESAGDRVEAIRWREVVEKQISKEATTTEPEKP